MNDKYDVVIVGAGPCGYMCAYELVKRNPNLKVGLFDRGLPVEKRHCPVLEHKMAKCPSGKSIAECYPSCSITNGFGGAGAYSDGKFNITTDFGGWLGEYVGNDELLKLIEYVDEVNLSYGATLQITDPRTPKILDIERRAYSAGLKLLRARVRHLGTEENLKILSAISADLEKKVDMHFATKVQDLIVENGKATGIILANGDKVYADHVVLGVGREGGKWLNEVMERQNVEMKQNRVDLGVRVECPDIIMDEINNNLYEGKFIYKTSMGTTVRTFCSNPGGHVVVENYEGVINVNGHSYSDPKLSSHNTNFALLVTLHFSEPFKKPNEYAMKVSSLANQLACGSVIVQTYGDLLKNRRSTPKRIEEGFVRPTLKEAVPGDLALCMPEKVLQSIIEMIQALDHITPGIASEHTLLYGVEAKYYSSHPGIKDTLEVSDICNLYVGGDGAGLTRGLAQASACGVYIARSILGENTKQN